MCNMKYKNLGHHHNQLIKFSSTKFKNYQNTRYRKQIPPLPLPPESVIEISSVDIKMIKICSTKIGWRVKSHCTVFIWYRAFIACLSDVETKLTSIWIRLGFLFNSLSLNAHTVPRHTEHTTWSQSGSRVTCHLSYSFNHSSVYCAARVSRSRRAPLILRLSILLYITFCRVFWRLSQ